MIRAESFGNLPRLVAKNSKLSTSPKIIHDQAVNSRHVVGRME